MIVTVLFCTACLGASIVLSAWMISGAIHSLRETINYHMFEHSNEYEYDDDQY